MSEKTWPERNPVGATIFMIVLAVALGWTISLYLIGLQPREDWSTCVKEENRTIEKHGHFELRPGDNLTLFKNTSIDRIEGECVVFYNTTENFTISSGCKGISNIFDTTLVLDVTEHGSEKVCRVEGLNCDLIPSNWRETCSEYRDAETKEKCYLEDVCAKKEQHPRCPSAYFSVLVPSNETADNALRYGLLVINGIEYSEMRLTEVWPVVQDVKVYNGSLYQIWKKDMGTEYTFECDCVDDYDYQTYDDPCEGWFEPRCEEYTQQLVCGDKTYDLEVD